MTRSRVTTAVGALLFSLIPSASGSATINHEVAVPAIAKGIVVERLTRGAEAEKAGVRPGDILLNWMRGDQKGAFESPFDLPYVRFDQASRGTIKIEGLRGRERQTWRLGWDVWGIVARPNFHGNLLSIYREGQEAAGTGNIEWAVARLRAAAETTQRSDSPWLASWLLSRVAGLWFDARHWDEYDSAYREAVEQADRAGPRVRAELFRLMALGFEYRDDLPHTERYYEDAVAEWQTLGPETMVLSNALFDLGVIALNRGDLAKAEACLRKVLAITEKLAPNSIQTALSLANLGVLSEERGDLAQAEQHYRAAVAIEERYFPRSDHLALTLGNLGTLVHQRGDLVKAEEYYLKALAMAERLKPGSLQVAQLLGYLGQCVLSRGDPARAEAYQRRALEIKEKLDPDGINVASSLASLGEVARVRGDLNKSQEYYRRALLIGDRLIPSSMEVARFLIGSGNVARDRGDFTSAGEQYRRALEILDKLAPGSLDNVETLAALAGTTGRQGQLLMAGQLYQQALRALEDKTAYLGGITKERSLYRAKHVRYYAEYVDLLLSQGQQEVAFQVLEGSRARTLLEALSQDHIDIRQGADASLVDHERILRQSLNAKSQYRIRLLNRAQTDGQLAAVDAEIAALLDRYQQVEAEIRAESPGYATLTQPQPLSAKEIQRLLDADTVLLEYSLGEERSYVFLVGQSSLAAYELPKRDRIEDLARRVHHLLNVRNREVKGETASQRDARLAQADTEYPKVAAELSRMILGPVAEMLPGKRLLIVSEGALQYVSFAALPAPAARAEHLAKAGVPLVVEHEIVNLPSASVMAELRRAEMGRKPASKEVAVLADPVFDSTDERITRATRAPSRASLVPERLTRSAADVGKSRNGSFYLNRLLYTREEAKMIISLIPPGKAMLALDFQASRAAATSSTLSEYRIVHFATHGLLDSKHPELSGLVLSMVDKRGKPQDGFLQLEDIYNLSLPVDLVVLSACDTGLGEEINGEGLVGLTRGFMYAGASRVMASLWSVNDAATSELMARFYKAMERDGMRPAAALRTAQIQMWRQKLWRSPYYWAAFQIQGEWR
jgi:CHAT domain-containing protein/tetratricopeptide (TPR) repeat protein